MLKFSENWILEVKVIQRSRSKSMGQQKGLVPRNVVSKYEVNPFINKEVMTNIKAFRWND
jgi:hypothetical protein